MTRPSKKDAELNALKTFLDVLAIPHATVEPRDPPDFVLTTASQRVVVEVVETLIPELARQASDAPRFAADIERALQTARVFADVHVHPHTNSAGLAALPASEQKEAVARIVALVAELAEEAATSATRFVHADLTPKLGEPPLFTPVLPRVRIPTLHGLSVHLRDDEQTEVAFGASASRWGGLRPRILEIVSAKEAKLDAYRKCCPADAYWLVLDSNGSFPAEIRCEEEVRGIEIESAFDAVGIVGPRTSTPAWARWLKAP